MRAGELLVAASSRGGQASGRYRLCVGEVRHELLIDQLRRSRRELCAQAGSDLLFVLQLEEIWRVQVFFVLRDGFVLK